MGNQVQINRHGVSIHGINQMLLCSSLFYFRIPRAEWEDRILKLKEAGYHCVDVYFPWNFHETSPSCWEFEGEKDVAAYLELLKKHGVYVVARPGPYICSEWDGGAIPAWVLTDPGLRIRQAEENWLARVREWYARILPILARYQLGEGGTVILLQLENELDFFDCQNPRAYLSALRDMAREMGITVPVFGCAGQCNAEGATGWAEGVETTYNFYGDVCDPQATPKFSYYYERMQAMGKPLLITETCCDHLFLRREMAAGAKLLGPYNQIGGTNFGFTGSIGNWGPDEAPESFNASWYAGDTLLGPAGEKNGQFGPARLFSSLIHMLGESLAKAESVYDETLQVACDFPTQDRFPLLRLCGGGWLLCLPNLGEKAGTARVDFHGLSFTVEIEGHSAPFLPLEIPLEPFGIPDTLVYATAEWNACKRKEGGTELVFTTASASPRAVIRTPHTELIFTREVVSTEGMTVAFVPPADFSGETNRKREERDIAPEQVCGQARCACVPFDTSSFRPVATGPLEGKGLYRGMGKYRLSATQGKGLLTLGCADILLTWRNGAFVDSSLCCGTSRYYPADGDYELLCYIWAHCNFDDGRLPGLRLTSGKGIRKAVAVKELREFPDNWNFSYAGLEIPEHLTTPAKAIETKMALNKWNSTRLPLTAVYRREICLDPSCGSRILSLEGADTPVWAYVDGSLIGKVNPFDPYLDLTEATRGKDQIELAFYTIRAAGREKMGLPRLYEGLELTECELATVADTRFPALSIPGEGEEKELPISFAGGSLTALSLPIPAMQGKGFYLYAEGRQLLLAISAGGRLLGRLLPGWEKAPPIAGDPNRLYCPASYCGEEKELHLLAFALEEGAELGRVRMEPVNA